MTTNPEALIDKLRKMRCEAYDCGLNGTDHDDYTRRVIALFNELVADIRALAAEPAAPQVAAAPAGSELILRVPVPSNSADSRHADIRVSELRAAAPEVADPAEPRPYPRMPDFFPVWLAIGTWREADHIEIAEKAALVDKRLEAVLRAYVDADRAAQTACTGGAA